MVRRRKQFGFGRRRRRGNRPRWTADIAALDPAAGALAYQRILSEADFGTSATLESECLVHRVVLHGGLIATAVGFATVDLGVVKSSGYLTPAFGVALDPGVIANLVDDDWLWTKRVILFRDSTATPTSGENVTLLEADIRVKRKLTSHDELFLVIRSATGGVDVNSDWALRILLTPRL